MPLNYLSNTEADYFTFDRANGMFALKPHVHEYWRDVHFRELLRERVVCALTRYFHRKGIDVSKCAFEIEARESAQDEDRAAGSAVPTTLLPFFPTLRVAAGYFREGNTGYDQSSIDIPDPKGRFRADRHLVV